MTNEEKILKMLQLIHEENKLIISGIMVFTNRPKNYEKNKNELLDILDKVVSDIFKGKENG